MPREIAGYPTNGCAIWTRRVIDHLVDDPTIDLVVFQTNNEVVPDWYTPDQVAAYQDATGETWQRLSSAGKRVAAVSDVPGVRPVLAPDCVAQEIPVYDPCSRPLTEVARPNLTMQRAASSRNVTAIDISRYFCDERRCHTLVGGVVVYRDSDYMTKTYADSLVRALGPDLVALLAK